MKQYVLPGHMTGRNDGASSPDLNRRYFKRGATLVAFIMSSAVYWSDESFKITYTHHSLDHKVCAVPLITVITILLYFSFIKNSDAGAKMYIINWLNGLMAA